MLWGMLQIALDSIHININFSYFIFCLSICLNIVLYYQAYYQRIILICQILKLLVFFVNLLSFEIIFKLVCYHIIYFKHLLLYVAHFTPLLYASIIFIILGFHKFMKLFHFYILYYLYLIRYLNFLFLENFIL